MNRSSFHIVLVSWLHFAPCFQDECLCSYRRKIQFPLAVGKKADSNSLARISQSIRESDVYRVEILWLKDVIPHDLFVLFFVCFFLFSMSSFFFSKRTDRLVQVAFDNNYQEVTF